MADHHTNSKFFFGMLIPVALIVGAIRVAMDGTEGLLTVTTGVAILVVTLVATVIEANLRRKPKKKRLDER